MPACSQHHGPDPAESLRLRVSWWLWCVPLPSLASPSPFMGQREKEGGYICSALSPMGSKQWPGSAGAIRAPPPSPTAHTHPAPSSPSSSFLPRPPRSPSTQHRHPAPRTMSLRLQLKPVSAGEGGQGKAHPVESPWGTPGTATLADSWSHPGHRWVPPASLGDKAEGIQQIFVVVLFLLIPAWKPRGLNPLLLQPQEPGARSRGPQQASEHREQHLRCSNLGLASPSCSQPGRTGQFCYKGGSIAGFPRHKA